MKRDFLSLNELSEKEFSALLSRAAELKNSRRNADRPQPLKGKTLAMVFEKSSTRTRVSFEVGMYELGGHAVYLGTQGSQIARGEPAEDTARVLGGYCDGIMLRTFSQGRAETFAKYSPVPVLNGLTDLFHPCQIAADLLTVTEALPSMRDATYAWIGDGNNMAHSWINAAGIFGLHLRLACPEGFEPDQEILASAKKRTEELGRGSVELFSSPLKAIESADVVSTDVWASMGQEEEAAARRKAFGGFCLDTKMLQRAQKSAIVLHCLPAHRGEEIAAEVLEGAQSRVWQQAENRLHVQKALLELFLAPSPR